MSLTTQFHQVQFSAFLFWCLMILAVMGSFGLSSAHMNPFFRCESMSHRNLRPSEQLSVRVSAIKVSYLNSYNCLEFWACFIKSTMTWVEMIFISVQIIPYFLLVYHEYENIPAFERIKEDDKMIQAEGVESLSEEELRQACRERGMLGSLSVEEMRQQVSFECHLLLFPWSDFVKLVII